MSTETQEPKLESWINQEIRVTTKQGEQVIRGLTHPLCPGLAVTSLHLGTFDVTHLASGKTISKGYERIASAMLELVELAHCADWTQSGEDVAAYLKEHGDESAQIEGATVTGGGEKRLMNKGEIVRSATGHMYGDDFPWEGSDGPDGHCADLLKNLAALKSVESEILRRSNTEVSPK